MDKKKLIKSFKHDFCNSPILAKRVEHFFMRLLELEDSAYALNGEEESVAESLLSLCDELLIFVLKNSKKLMPEIDFLHYTFSFFDDRINSEACISNEDDSENPFFSRACLNSSITRLSPTYATSTLSYTHKSTPQPFRTTAQNPELTADTASPTQRCVPPPNAAPRV
jgi:hypothetical protein